MSPISKPIALLASPDPVLAQLLAPIFDSLGFILRPLASAAALLSVSDAYAGVEVILLDERLPGIHRGELLAALQDTGVRRHASIALVTDGEMDESATQRWLERLADGILEDIVPRDSVREQWATHMLTLRRTAALQREVETMREATLRQVQNDRLTGTLNREAMLSALFRETDRVQRMNGSLCLLMVDIDDFGHWNAELGNVACDELLNLVSRRIEKLMRSYDLLGRIGNDEFLLALPGCSMVNAVMLAERLRSEIFAEPFAVDSQQIRLSACFGITSSRGRSPVVVLREAEQVLAAARLSGPDQIRTWRDAANEMQEELTMTLPLTGTSLAF